MDYSADSIEKNARDDEKLNKELIRIFKKKPPRNLDEIFQDAHERVFERVDCLTCANCCRFLGPRITDKDIERLSKQLKVKAAVFVQTYLRMDEDNDYVFREMPCPFLESDNKCRVYDHRPKACREYPHTDRKKMHQILDLSLKNTYVCPAVNEILGELRLWRAGQ